MAVAAKSARQAITRFAAPLRSGTLDGRETAIGTDPAASAGSALAGALPERMRNRKFRTCPARVLTVFGAFHLASGRPGSFRP